tara:strand:- start:1831 stop:3141 length:1311 start_codon:yes stop_codon:yes gene_type:complete
MKKILLIGSGAREVAVARKIKASKQRSFLFCVSPSINPHISCLAQEYFCVSLSDNKKIVNIAKKLAVDFVFVGPENPLENGLVDDLESSGIACVAPKKSVAKIETSKAFARNILDGCCPEKNPKRKEFFSLDGVEKFLSELGGGHVIKYDGLMGGKGVKISGEHLACIKDSVGYCKEIIDMGGSFLIEEKLVGEEFSLMSFCDGEHCAHMPLVQDHKRAFEGDVGPNTGGMGTYSFENHSLPFLFKEEVLDAQKTNERVLRELKRSTGESFKGVLYGGFIATKAGVRVIEYNARFGDPEALNVLALLKTDFIDVCDHIVGGSLNVLPLEFEHKATVCKYAVPSGYPESPEKNFKISYKNMDDPCLFFAAVKEELGEVFATGSRTAAYVGTEKTVEEAERVAEKGVQRISGNLFHRKDIGTKRLIQKRIDNMKRVRQ